MWLKSAVNSATVDMAIFIFTPHFCCCRGASNPAAVGISTSISAAVASGGFVEAIKINNGEISESEGVDIQSQICPNDYGLCRK